MLLEIKGRCHSISFPGVSPSSIIRRLWLAPAKLVKPEKKPCVGESGFGRELGWGGSHQNYHSLPRPICPPLCHPLPIIPSPPPFCPSPALQLPLEHLTVPACSTGSRMLSSCAYPARSSQIRIGLLIDYENVTFTPIILILISYLNITFLCLSS